MKEITAEEALKLSNEAKSRLERQSRDARAAASAVALTEFVFDIVKHTKGMLDNNSDLSPTQYCQLAKEFGLSDDDDLLLESRPDSTESEV